MANPKGNPESLKAPKKGEVRNPKGAPKKIVSVLNDELKAEGYTPVTDSQVLDCLRTLINLPLSRLKSIANITNDDVPMLYKKMAKCLIDPKDHQTLDKLLDRAYGKAKQAVDLTSDGDKIVPQANAPLSDAQFELLINAITRKD
jgi:hypothetical protein